jgi:hypothetical protein
MAVKLEWEQLLDTSTVVQEGRIKTPKRKPPMDDDDEFLESMIAMSLWTRESRTSAIMPGKLKR